MANVLIPKKSTVAAKQPTTSDLALGEIAINHADAKLFARHPVSGAVQEIGGGGSVTIDTSAADLLSFSSGTLSADDLGSDKIFFWDDSAAKATGLEIGAGLEISGTTLSASGDTVSIDPSAADVLSATSGSISADDAGADKLLFWDESEGKLTHLELGNALSISGTTLNASTGSHANYWIPASAWIPRTTNGCGVDSREIGSTNRQNFDELLFDAAAIEYAQALHILPSTYNNSTVTVRFYWTASSGSGGVVWGIQGRALADDDALDIAFGTAQTVTDTLLAADDMHITSASSAVTLGGTPAANTPIQFQLYRDATNAADTLAVDARLLGVEISFTPV